MRELAIDDIFRDDISSGIDSAIVDDYLDAQRGPSVWQSRRRWRIPRQCPPYSFFGCARHARGRAQRL